MALWLLSPLQIHIIFCSFGWLLSLPQRRYLERSTTQKMRSGIVGNNSDDGIIASPAYSRITYTHNMRCVITRKSRTPTNNSKQKKNNIGKMLYNCNLVIFYVYLSPSVLLSLARSAPLCHTIQHAYAKSNGLFSARLHASFFDVPRQILKWNLTCVWQSFNRNWRPEMRSTSMSSIIGIEQSSANPCRKSLSIVDNFCILFCFSLGVKRLSLVCV